jgi:hypothetical protein
MRSVLRSIGAVGLGYIVTAALVFGGFVTIGAIAPDALPAGASERASTAVLITILALGVFQAAIGGYVTGATAKRAPLLHAVALAGLMLLLGIVSSATPDATAVHQPAWYNIGLIAVGVVGALAGGEVRSAQLHHRMNAKRVSLRRTSRRRI